MLPPINQMFKNYQSGHRIHIWLFESLNFRIEGRILVSLVQFYQATSTYLYVEGFDEYMNLVVDDAVKVSTITKTERDETRTPLGTFWRSLPI